MDKSIFTEFVDTGVCVLNTAKVVEQWVADSFISQWRDEYTLVGGINGPKAKMSKQQAKELIVELDLLPEQSPVFNSGKTWRKVESPTTPSVDEGGER